MLTNIKLSYDVYIQEHRTETKEINFSIEDFKNWIEESEYPLENESDLKDAIFDYFSDMELDEPRLKDNEDVDWSTFEVLDVSLEDILPEVKYLFGNNGISS